MATWREVGWSQAGWAPRLVLSIISGVGLLSSMAFGIGLFGSLAAGSGESIPWIVLGLAGIVWCCTLTAIWTSLQFFRKTLRAALAVIGAWWVAFALCVLLGGVVTGGGPDVATAVGVTFLIVLLAVAVAGTVWLPVRLLRRHTIGEPIFRRTGEVNVKCPGCGYSMVGLAHCQCPECGVEYTIDGLIGAQGYCVVKFGHREAPVSGDHGKAAQPGGQAGNQT